MRLRGIWIISTSEGEKCRVLLSKNFPTVESRFKSFCSKSPQIKYKGIPTDEKMVSIFVTALKEKSVAIDKDVSPIFHSSKSSLWPIVYYKSEYDPFLYFLGKPNKVSFFLFWEMKPKKKKGFQ